MWLGGMLRGRDNALEGDSAVQFLKRYKVDIGIISAWASTPDGTIRDRDQRDRPVDWAVHEQARETWLVADSSKFSQQALAKGHQPGPDGPRVHRNAPPQLITQLLHEAQVALTIAPDTMAFFLRSTKAPPAPAASFSTNGARSSHQRNKIRQHYPQPGWVGTTQSWRTQRDTAARPCANWPSKGRDLTQLRGRHHQPARDHRAVAPRHRPARGAPSSGKDRRTEPQCAQWREQGLADTIRQKTGLIIDPTFRAASCNGCWTMSMAPAPRQKRANWRSGRWTAGYCGT